MRIHLQKKSSNNTNKFNPQEHLALKGNVNVRSNNTNKFNPQELSFLQLDISVSSNNTNKFNPQERNDYRC